MPSHRVRRRGADEHRRKEVVLLAQSRHAEKGPITLLSDHVHDIVGGNAAEEPATLVHHRSGDEVALLEEAGHLVGGSVRVDAALLGAHQLRHLAIRSAGEEIRETHLASVAVLAIDHEETVGLFGYLAAAAQVALDHLQAHVRAHRHHVQVHETARGVLRVGEDGLEAVALLGVERFEHFLDDRLRQVLQDVGRVVVVHLACDLGERRRFHPQHARGAHRVFRFREDLRAHPGVETFPEHVSLRHRQGLEEQRDVGRVHSVEDAAHPVEVAAFQRVQGLTQSLFVAGVLVVLGHGLHVSVTGSVR